MFKRDGARDGERERARGGGTPSGAAARGALAMGRSPLAALSASSLRTTPNGQTPNGMLDKTMTTLQRRTSPRSWAELPASTAARRALLGVATEEDKQRDRAATRLQAAWRGGRGRKEAARAREVLSAASETARARHQAKVARLVAPQGMRRTAVASDAVVLELSASAPAIVSTEPDSPSGGGCCVIS